MCLFPSGEGNGKPIQYSCLENPMNSMKIMKILKLRVIHYYLLKWTEIDVIKH